MQRRLDVTAIIERSGAQAADGVRDHLNPSLANLLAATRFESRFVRGEGAHLWTDDGTRIIDCLTGFGALLLGREHPVVKDALRQCIDAGPPAWVRFSHNGLAVEAARRLKECCGRPDDRVYFSNSGTEGVEAAIKLARRHTGRSGLVAWEDGFHGFTLGSLSIGGNPDLAAGFGALVPECTTVPFGDLAAMERALSGRSVAAVVVEPVQGKTLRSLSPSAMRDLHELCRRHGTVLVADEVQSGLGRTGTFLATEHDGVEPDIVVVSKGLGGGYVPVAATLARPDIWSSTFTSMERAFVHGSTHHEGPLAMIAAIATLDVIASDGLVARARSLGQRMAEGLRAASEGSPFVQEIRGRGMMLGTVLQTDGAPSLRPIPWLGDWTSPMVGQAVVMDLYRDGHVLAQVTGARRPLLKLLPPLVLEEDDADHVVRAVPEAISRLGRGSALRAVGHAAIGLVRNRMGR
jgi:ornithine--oxo-acid transaminase